ncbi:endonuclease G, mitochondrial [Drosophila pseudoobscura]|uniref:Endonuclease G, mitochondrial n=1 Tax=Drosophila pseudoobscura pseudoobscura TaxID=46245 RepID=B5DQL5_DROPS|nr:endonuclease G, mitochondrial [Drosophila pseudoobscura]
MPIYIIFPLIAVSGAVGFLIGALAQQDISYRKLNNTMVSDAYVYQSRRKIFKSLSFLGITSPAPAAVQPTQNSVSTMSGSTFAGSETESSEIELSPDTGSMSLFEQFILWSRSQVNHVIMFMTFSIGAEQPQYKEISHVASIMKYGFPGMDEIHVYKNFVVSYDRRNRIAHWVCEHLKGECLTYRDPQTLEKPNEYIPDASIPTMFSANMRDFRNSEWVGGHMASPQNYKCDIAMFTEAYKFPNIVPISRALKNNVWLRLEHYVRELALKSGSVYVYTGPMFMPQRITFRNWAIRHHVMGMNTVAVPTHFFKVIISEHKQNDDLPFVEGYVVPNAEVDAETDLRSFLADVRDIEHFAGLKFFDGDQRKRLDFTSSDSSLDIEYVN